MSDLVNCVSRPARGALPCPFCGNHKLDIETDERTEGCLEGKGAYVRCPQCSGMGPSTYEAEIGRGVIKEALVLWNKRWTTTTK